MCGIVAALGLGREDEIFDALDQMHYRGVTQSLMSNQSGTIGHTRLPIVGLGEENNQPVRREEWVIAFVGEVLDFRDNDPRIPCDLNVVVDSWLRDGPEGLISHDGFWAVVALGPHGSLHIVCDYLGQKPMYYRRDILAAASELDALASMAPVTLDEAYLSACIKWGYCPDPIRTPYREISRVLPGEHIELNHYRRRIVDTLVPRSGDLKFEIEAAVRRRVIAADVPIACLVSGGLDSAIVHTLAERHSTVNGYYVSDGENHDELKNALRVASRGLDISHSGNISAEEALTIMQEPIDLGSLIPQIILSRAVNEIVCLTGDGADEGFGGYSRSERYDSQGSDIFQELVCWHLPRLDRVMMRETIETRSPFLARRVLEIALALPVEARRGKRILKDLFRNDLPPSIADQPKVPLRTKTIAVDREANSRHLVNMFREMRK